MVAVGLCFWQNGFLLEIANGPLPGDREPITFGVTEPFLTTVKLSAYAGILLALPVILYQAYSFILPAFQPAEQRVVMPLLMAVPVLFIAGAMFAYFVVMPAALDFLLGFNADAVQDRDPRQRVLRLLRPHPDLGRGPVPDPGRDAGDHPAGDRHPGAAGGQPPLRDPGDRGRRDVLPGTDPVTMLISMAPLYGLFELSLLLARRFGRPPATIGRWSAASSGPA